ncbi:hypothetical protein KUV75_07245 [Qipengyuania gaetbuli]|uniref:hypothetical protein n=1 Tax=Qipengyuania gaetbuli TaxID=266952 RepID=UPI001C99A7C9|nr:hypothetical protein [Qipengyuania gaetbuli]MBY6014694.1 hypothetical protein [Qipengyuania gaetbuli]
MTSKKQNGASTRAGALTICQNLAQLTAYELAGDQALVPNVSQDPASAATSLILMPGVKLASEAMAQGIAKLGTSALGVRSLQGDAGDQTADFTVLYATRGKAERCANMRAWVDRERNLYLIPETLEDSASPETCFKFDRGLRKVARPWEDKVDRDRGLAEANALLLAKRADSRLS